MSPPGRIVVLDGPPRAGKSAIAAAMQQAEGGSWINLGVDTMMAALPERLRPGIGLRPGGERPDLEPLVGRLYAALFDAIAAHARQQLDVVADLAIHDGYSRPMNVRADMARRLAGLPVLLVAVRCPLETIMARRNADPRGGYYAAGEGIPAPVRRWQEAMERSGPHDLELDTSVVTPEQAAEAIGRALADPTGPGVLERWGTNWPKSER